MKCKNCGNEYDIKETKRAYGDMNWINNMCSAQCYTKSIVIEEEIIKLPCFGIKVILTGDGGGSVTSDLKEDIDSVEPSQFMQNEIDGINRFNDMMDALESLILAHACAGVCIDGPSYIEGIETALQQIGNNL